MQRRAVVTAVALVFGAALGLVVALAGVIFIGRLVAPDRTSYEDLFPFLFVAAPLSVIAGAMGGRRLARGKR